MSVIVCVVPRLTPESKLTALVGRCEKSLVAELRIEPTPPLSVAVASVAEVTSTGNVSVTEMS